MNKLTNMLKLPAFALRLLPAEFRTLQAAEPSALSGMLDITLGMMSSELVETIPRGDKTARLVRTPTLVLSSGDIWLESDTEYRHRCVRQALGVLDSEQDAGRLIVSQSFYPGGVYVATRLSTGPGDWVQRAAWRDKHGNARVGRRPGEPLWASEVEMPGEHEEALFEVWEDGELVRVVAASGLYPATFSEREYPVETLKQREDLRRAKKAG